MARRYYLAPWQWSTTRRAWEPPATECLGALDLRADPACGRAGSGTGYGLFVYAADQTIGRSVDLGDDLNGTLPKGRRDGLRAALGITDAERSTRLLDVLWDALTVHADPTGQNRVRPILPTRRGQLELHLGGHSLVRSRPAEPAAPEWAIVREAYRAEYRQLRAAVEAGNLPPGFHRSTLTVWAEQFPGVDPVAEFIPDDLPPEDPLPHNTTISDDFTRANGDTIGNQLTWTEVSGDWDTFSNRAGKSADETTQQYARAESDLSSADHYAQCKVYGDSTSATGPAARFAAAATTCYIVMNFSDQLYVSKIVTGTQTNLANNGHTWAAGETYKVECNGSTIKGYANGAEVTSVTDSAITGNTRAGITAYKLQTSAAAELDDFEAADLGGGGGGLTAGQRMLLGLV